MSIIIITFSIYLVSRGASGVVLAVEEASDVGEVAVFAWHPKVAGAGVKDDLEGLGRSSNGDGSEVLGVHVVGQGLGLGSRELVTPSKNKPKNIKGNF